MIPVHREKAEADGVPPRRQMMVVYILVDMALWPPGPLVGTEWKEEDSGLLSPPVLLPRTLIRSGWVEVEGTQVTEYEGMEREKEMSNRKFKRICVFCGSSQGKKRSYQDAAIELGNELVSRNIDLVYGGGSIGLMGLISQAVYDGGRHVIGVIPKMLMPREITGETVGEVKPVADMHQRKAEMARRSDAFIALPGGYGTLEELLEVITWAQLGIHDKPVGLLNVEGYYNSLLSFIDKAVEEGFISPNARCIIVSAPTAKDLVKKMEEYFPRHEKVAPKLNWEIEQVGYPPTCEISG